MNTFARSLITAAAAVCCIQVIAIGVVAPRLSRSVAAFPSAKGHPQIVHQTEARTFRIENLDGNIIVQARPNGSFEANASYRIFTHERGENASAESYAESLFDIEDDGQVFTLRTEPNERPDGMDVFADYIITLPIGSDIEIDNANGNVEISPGLAEVRVRGRNADIWVGGAEGLVTARSTNGRIKIYGAEAGIDAHTVNGNISAHVLGGALAAQTTNGSIVARLLDPTIDECSLTTRNGGITVVMNEECSADLEARTARGAVKSDILVDASAGIERRRHVRGVIGAGATALTMDSLNGNIWITRSP